MAEGFDVVIAGAGPAGLIAARTLARLGFRTIVLEQQPAPAEVHRPCNGLLSAMPGYFSAEQRDGGTYFPEIDLSVPSGLVVGYPEAQSYISPGGQELTHWLQEQGRAPTVVVNKSEMVGYMADAAAKAGAELRYGVRAAGLLRRGRQVVGVWTPMGEISADLVVSAEGVAGELCMQAGLYAQSSGAGRFALTVSEELEAPQVGPGQLGYLVTFGRRYSSAVQGMGTVVMPAPGQATVSFTIFSDRVRYQTDPELWFYLDEYVRNDRRVRGLLSGARIVERLGYQHAAGQVPVQIVRDGFLATGDAIAPGRQMGILPAAFVGRWAGLIAAESLDSGDTSAAALEPYDRRLRGTVLANLELEERVLAGLTRLTDDEIDRLFILLSQFHRSEPFFASWQTLPWAAVRWLMGKLPVVEEDYGILQRLLGSGPIRLPADIGEGVDFATLTPKYATVAPYSPERSTPDPSIRQASTMASA